MNIHIGYCGRMAYDAGLGSYNGIMITMGSMALGQTGQDDFHKRRCQTLFRFCSETIADQRNPTSAGVRP